VDRGIVIDHIGTGTDPASIWAIIDKIRHLLDLNVVSSHGVYPSESQTHFKGIISIPDITELDEKHLKMLAAISPDCTINIVDDSQVIKKYRLRMPPRVYKLEGLCCSNESCISNPNFHEPIFPDFLRQGKNIFICRYCNTPHEYKDIWS
jgi:aspartate carbamoyltransferase